MFRHLKYIKKN